MANQRKDMITIRQLIRLKSEGKSHKYIARSLGISRTTVVEYVKQLSEKGLTWHSLLALPDESLDVLLQTPYQQSERYEQLLSFFPYMEEELKKTGVSRHLLWEEHQREADEPYGYSQFCYHYQQWSKAGKATAPIIHKAGDKLYVDFAGKTMEIIDADSGEMQKVQIFVAVLGASGYTYVRACHSQKQQDFIDCLEHCLRFFGGVPAAIVPDNLKSAVSKSCKYEPQLTTALKQFALHYQTVILPARSYKPKDKALVENAVKNVYRALFAPLRDELFFSLEALNQALEEQLQRYNNRKYTHRPYSRRELFERIEQVALKPLPVESFCLKKQVRTKVQKNGHIWLSEDKHYYSVPYRFIGQRVQVCYSSHQVEIYSEFKRIAFHLRNRKGYGYTTESSHLSSTHRFVSEWSPKKFKDWADKIGKETATLIDKIFETKPHPEQAYKSCLGILSLAKKVGHDRLNHACARALHYQSYYYNTVKRILEKGLDRQELFDASVVLPIHDNIRGSHYYQ